MAEEYETEFKKCDGMRAVRNAAGEYAHVEPQVAAVEVGIPIVVNEEVATEQVPIDVEPQVANSLRRRSA